MSIMYEPLHPGEIVKEVLLTETGFSITEAAKRLAISRPTLSSILNCHAGISPEMALRLSKLLGTSIELWVNLQAQYDAWQISRQAKHIKIKPLIKTA